MEEAQEEKEPPTNEAKSMEACMTAENEKNEKDVSG